MKAYRFEFAMLDYNLGIYVIIFAVGKILVYTCHIRVGASMVFFWFWNRICL